MTERRRDLLVAGGLILIVVLLFFDVIFLDSALYLRDLTSYEWSIKVVVRDLVRSGEFPYWNPFYSAGQPLAANPAYQMFYPLQWPLLFLTGLLRAYQVQIVAHIAIAAVGMYAFLRSLQLGVGASLFGAASFAFGGGMMSLLNLVPILYPFAWTPLVALFSLRYMATPRLRDLTLAAVCLGMQVLLGEPSTILQTGILLLAFALAEGNAVQRVFRLGFIIATGVAIGAAQLIPMLDLFRDTIRAAGFARGIAGAWSMPPVRPLELFFPEILGKLDAHGFNYWGARLYGDRGWPFILSIYPGLLAAVLAVVAVFTRVRYRTALVTVALISFVLAAGAHTPLFELARAAGLFRGVRFPERFILIGIFCVIVLAALMFQRLADRDRSAAARVRLCSAIVLIVAAGFAVFSLSGAYEETFRRVWRINDRIAPLLLADSRHAAWTAAVKSLGIVGLAWLTTSNVQRRVWAMAVAAFVVTDLSPFPRVLAPRISYDFFSTPALVGKMPPRPGEYRLFHWADWLRDEPERRGYFRSVPDASYWTTVNGLFPPVPAIWGFRTALEKGVDATMLQHSSTLLEVMHRVGKLQPAEWMDRYAAISNVNVIAVFKPFIEEMKRVGGDLSKAEPVVLQRAGPYPRYYFADRVIAVRSVDEFVTAIGSESFTPTTALVQEVAVPAAAGEVLSVRETPNQATLEVKISGDGFLVASNSYHRYWRATVDGREVPVHRTNLAYQGVAVPAGRHRVHLRYRNPLIVPSVLLSIVTLLLLCAFAARELFRSGDAGERHRQAFASNHEAGGRASPAS